MGACCRMAWDETSVISWTCGMVRCLDADPPRLVRHTSKARHSSCSVRCTPPPPMTMLNISCALLFAVILLLVVVVEAVSNLNTTVDDTDLSIQYSPPAAWHSRSKYATIGDNPLSRTWHDGGAGSLHFARDETETRPVVMEFEFTGSAIYVYACSPSSPSQITSTVDNLPLLYTPPHGTSDSVLLSRVGLSEAVHHLQLTVHNGARISFDYLKYTRSAPSGDDQIELNLSPRRRSVGDGKSNDQQQPHKNVATFAGAIGGGVGALALIALGLAISIIRRRRLARNRTQEPTDAEGADVSSLFTDGSHDRPPMHGPTPFVPKYFPGTVLPLPDSRRSSTSKLPVAGGVERGQEWRDSGYAERPPPAAPLRLDGVVEDVEEERGQVAPPSSAAEDTVVYPRLPPAARTVRTR